MATFSSIVESIADRKDDIIKKTLILGGTAVGLALTAELLKEKQSYETVIEIDETIEIDDAETPDPEQK